MKNRYFWETNLWYLTLNDPSPKCQNRHWEKYMAFSLYAKNHKNTISFKGVHMINDLFIQWFGSPSSCWAQTETRCGLAVESASPFLRVPTLSENLHGHLPFLPLPVVSAPKPFPFCSLCSLSLQVRLTLRGPTSATLQPKSCGLLVRYWILLVRGRYFRW